MSHREAHGEYDAILPSLLLGLSFIVLKRFKGRILRYV